MTLGIMTLGTLLTTAHTTGAPAGTTHGTLPTHGMTRGIAARTGDGATDGTDHTIAITDHTTGHITDVPHTEEADISPTVAHHTEEVPMAMATAATEYIVAVALPAEEAQGLHRHRHQQGAAPSATTQAVAVTSVTAAPMEEAVVLHEAAVLSAIAARHAAAAHSVTVVHSVVAAHAAVAVASAVVAHAAVVHTVAEEDNA